MTNSFSEQELSKQEFIEARVYRSKSLSKQEFIETRVYRNKSLSEKNFLERIYVEEPLSQAMEKSRQKSRKTTGVR